MKIPFPVELDAKRSMSLDELEQFVAELALKGDEEPLMPSFLMWARCGRLSYRLEHDLLEALLLSDVPKGVILLPPHECMWIDLKGQTDCLLQGEPLAGFFLRTVGEGGESEDGEWIGVATTRLLDDGSNNTLWFHAVDNGKRDGMFTASEKMIADQLRHVAALVTLYLMDPAHEQAPETLRASSLWTRRMKKAGAKDPARTLAHVKHRLLGGSYRLPSEAYEGTGRTLVVRTPIRGHIRMQRVGPGWRDLRATWVKPHWRGPADAPTQAILADVKKPASPSLSDEQRRLRVIEAMRGLAARQRR